MKPILTYISAATTLVLSTVGLLNLQTAAIAGQEPRFPTRMQLERLHRDLVPSRTQEIFRQWREKTEKEIRTLQRQNLDSECLLEVNDSLINADPSLSSSSNPLPDCLDRVPRNSS